MSTDTLEDIKIDEKINVNDKEPSKFNVIMMNDDSTPMEWVIQVLKEIYRHSDKDAESLTMTIHTEGSAVVGTYSYEIAEQKSVETINASRNHGFPLGLKIEEAE
jgi:ATP-dependent Clp protease adaptor protein ClpS